MVRPLVLALCALTLVGCDGGAPAPNAQLAAALQGSTSVGGVRLGMTRGQVAHVLGAPTARLRHDEVWSWKGPELDVLFIRGKVAGIEVTGGQPGRIKTDKGVGIGSGLADLRAAYGADLRRDNGMYVVGKAAGALSFDVGSDGTVDAIYLGQDWD